MSHNFKRPSDSSARERRRERQIKVMALQIHNQAMLDKLLEGAAPPMRQAMIDRLTPFLRLTPDVAVSADCPTCGLRRGTIIDHECLTANPALPN